MQIYNNPILIQPTREMPRKIGIIGAGADIGRFPSMLGDSRQCIDYARITGRSAGGRL